MIITDNFYYEWKPSRAYHKIDTFAVVKDEWDTKKGTGHPSKNGMNTCEWDNGHTPLIKITCKLCMWVSVMLHLSDTVDDCNADNRSS